MCIQEGHTTAHPSGTPLLAVVLLMLRRRRSRPSTSRSPCRQAVGEVEHYHSSTVSVNSSPLLILHSLHYGMTN
ncbi:unnamed protein product [Rangifer tarandus platyrhynchus]|uniref:Uncharacterized protein n=1 Tax=Rangifer tarandus platyrhynchus TaxID=3082113 RepID=A0ACB1KG80_RANTA